MSCRKINSKRKRQAKQVKTILSLGANIGKIHETFRFALSGLRRAGLCEIRISPLYETEAVGCAKDTPDFINAAVSGIWGESLALLHSKCKEIEIKCGRPLKHPRWDSRTLDIDIVFFGQKVFSNKNITVPHKEALNRLFVLGPVSDIEPGFMIPGKEIAVSKYIELLGRKKEILKMIAKSIKLDL
jgi:2-amino-4-hydroxy-6-hydroxymethyldihydropteridine diphosphokinase